MKLRLLLWILLIVPVAALCQNPKYARQKSHQTFVYRISAATTEQYINLDSIPVDNYLGRNADYVVSQGSFDVATLPAGHYLCLEVVENRIRAEIAVNSNLIPYLINNEKILQLAIRDKHGNVINDARVWLNRKELKYLPATETFRIKYHPRETDLIKIYAKTDTIFLNLEADIEQPSVFSQRWKRFKTTTTGGIVTYIPNRVINLISGRNYRSYPKPAGKGFIAFNQPKYKPGDTVKLKAYILNRRNKPYKAATTAYLQYYNRGKYFNQSLADIKPSTPGAYLIEFILSDTLPNDVNYTVNFQSRKKKPLVKNSFKTEDYVLDEVENFSLKSAKERYFKGDSLSLLLSAKDANGLNLLDAKVHLILTVTKIHKWNGDSLLIPDTLYSQERKLETRGDTKIIIPSSNFPDATLELNATAIFRNSNNEIQEQEIDIDFSAGKMELAVNRIKDSISVEYRENGNIVPAPGMMKIEGSNLELLTTITYPARIKIDPLAEEYSFQVENDSTIYETLDIEADYQLSFNRYSNGDTIGFNLLNPYAIPVYYVVMDGDHAVATNKSSGNNLQYVIKEKNERKAYQVKWQYVWAGKENKGEGNFGHNYKQLSIKIDALNAVFPGQRDSLKINVNDFRQRPAEGVNLTTFSYNSQFNKAIKLPQLPYLAKHKIKYGFRRDTYEFDFSYLTKRYYLGAHQAWLNKFGLDTMLYYQMLFPGKEYFHHSFLLNEHYPQLSIYAVHKGIPQQVYLAYVNKRLVYYQGVSSSKHYSFRTISGFTNVAFRLYDRLIEIDSIYIQPNYKHELVFDLDHLPARAKITPLSGEFTTTERNLLEKSLFNLKEPNLDQHFIWQNGEAVQLGRSNSHIVGPFLGNDSLHYFAPGRFDLHFIFEPGYQYKLSPRTSRLEKMKIFPNQDKPVSLRRIVDPKWTTGDTILPPPVISYPSKSKTTSHLKLSNDYYYRYPSSRKGLGTLQFTLPRDTVLSYLVLIPIDHNNPPIILNGNLRKVYNLQPGKYTLLLVRKDFKSSATSLVIMAEHTSCLNINKLYFSESGIVTELTRELVSPPEIKTQVQAATETSLLSASDLRGNVSISGKIIDAQGKKAIPAVYVQIKGTTLGVIADDGGYFSFREIKEGNYTLVFAAIGYESKEVSIQIEQDREITVALRISNVSLEEVVVTGYSTTRKIAYAASVAVVNENRLEAALSGMVAGIDQTGSPGSAPGIQLRGISSANGANKPIYVVDGIVYDELPGNFLQEDITSIDVLTGADATAIYGARAAYGVVVITTKTKSMREQFRDYAFWHPQAFTNKSGEARLAVTYPDNITSWQTYVIGIDKKNRTGIAAKLTRAYKPVMAQLSLPQFAIEGDQFNAITKTLNYTKDDYNIAAKLTSASKEIADWHFKLPSSESVINPQIIFAGSDTLQLQYSIATSTGFKDGEERKVPIMPKGVKETSGEFYILNQDSTITFSATKDASIKLYIQDNNLDLLLTELDHLQKYPYYCTEQIASKIKGYLAEQVVRNALRQDFKNKKDLQRLIDRLLKMQRYDGSWSWWDNGQPNNYITSYIVQTLLAIRENPLAEQAIRNGLLYLQNQLPVLRPGELLNTLSTLALAGHHIDYHPHLSTLHFDSLTIHQKWTYTQIKQLLKIDHSLELDYLLRKKKSTMTGGAYWGEETYRWYDNNTATTVLAYTVLQNREANATLLPSIIQYFLELRNTGYWRNTVESASITSAILPKLLQDNNRFNSGATITVTGDTSFVARSFPFSGQFSSNIKNLQVQKLGGGLTYITLYQQWWNRLPLAMDDKFLVTTSFLQNDQPIMALRAGERVKMRANIKAMQRAEYVMIEMPIPAGAIVINKATDGYTQYFKDKVVIFRERLGIGDHLFEVDLECRYEGIYTLNPAKAELMYFPTFFGRNGIKSIELQ